MKLDRTETFILNIIYGRSDIYMGLLRMIVLVMVVLWLLGFALNIGGGLIHTLIVIAVIVFIFDLIGGRRI